jgi:chaperone required for assembly of F1-ATPase
VTKSSSPFGPLDPEAIRQQEERIRKLAREAMPDLPKRFYKEVGTREAAAPVAPDAPHYEITLDGRPMRTPAKKVFQVPGDELATAVADEWAAQETLIDPRTMPLTRLSNVVIDGVVDKPEALREEIAAYVMNDLVCYRADGPSGLIDLQARHWNGALDWAESELGARPALATGIMPVDQPDALRDGMHRAIAPLSPFALAAVHVITTMTGSALFAAMLVAGAIGEDELWTAAHVDEDWQITQWGKDAEAAERRAKRRIEFDAACRMIAFTA